MNEVKINQIYRHFKGKYVYIKDIALNSETSEPCVIYNELDNYSTWVRKLSMFFEDINRKDNVTKQDKRFKLIEFSKEGIK